MQFDWKMLFAAYEPILLQIAVAKVGALHKSIDDTDKLNSFEKSALDAVTNIVAGAVVAQVQRHTASVTAATPASPQFTSAQIEGTPPGGMTPMITIPREDLIAHCEASVVPEKEWHNRDSSAAQRQLGEYLVLLKAGCDYLVYCGDGSVHKRDTNTWEVHIQFFGFMNFEYEDAERDEETFYLPSPERLESRKGRDWY